MLERDYLMKQVNQLIAVLNRVLAIVLKLQKQPDIDVSFEEVNGLLEEHLSLSVEDLLSIPEEALIAKLIGEHQCTYELIGQIGDLLYEIAKISSDIPYSREALQRRALVLYDYVEAHEEVYSIDRHFRKEEIVNLLAD